MRVKLLNVKLPFIEAVEYLKTDSDVLGCICLNMQRPCAITLNELSELRVIENNFFEEYHNEPLIDRLLTIDNILYDDWLLVIKDKLFELS